MFFVKTLDPAYNRVYGAKHIPALGSWVFPAFHPFSELVRADLEILKDDGVTTSLDEKAEAWALEQASYPDRIAQRALDPSFTFHTKPYDHQVESVAYAVHNLRCLLALAMGAGKALRDDQPVLTPDRDWVRIGDLRVGDYAYGADGLPHRVTGVFPQGVRNLYEVTFSDGATVVCDEEHLWTVNTPDRNNAGRPPFTRTLRQLLDSGLVYNTKTGTNRKYFLPDLQPIYYPDVTLPVDPYTLGVLIGDGGLTNGTVTLTCFDSEIVDALRLPVGVEVARVASIASGGAWILRRTARNIDNELTVKLVSLGLMGRGSKEKFIPLPYLRCGVEQRMELLRGLMDTDGTVNSSGKHTYFCTSSPCLKDDVVELVRSLGGTATVATRSPTYTYLGKKRVGALAYRVTIKLPASVGAPFKLSRKLGRWRRPTKYPVRRSIVAAKEVAPSAATCIQVDATDALFVTKDYVLTHNTKVAIDTLRYVKQFVLPETKALVIVPRVILHKWGDEVLFHGGGDLKPVVVDGTPKKRAKLIREEGDVYVVTYGTATRMQEELVEVIPYDTFIVDESHNLQSHDSDKTKAVTYLSRKAPRRILMSGTAALGDPRHLWGQFAVMAPFMNEENFYKFCWKFISYGDQQRRIITGFRNLDLLNTRLKRISIQRTKEECLDLPERTFDVVKYSLEGEQKKAYNQLVAADYADAAEMLHVPEDAVAATRLIKLLQICSSYIVDSNKDPKKCDGCPHLKGCVQNGVRPYTKGCQVVPKAPEPTVIDFDENPKLKAFEELLEMALVDPTAKVVVWGHFLRELDHVEKAVGDMGYKSLRIDGSVGASRMQERVKQFQTDPDVRVFIGQIACGIGIDLTAANINIYVSLDYDLGHWLQSLDRSHRIGQTRKLSIYALLGEGTVEEAVWDALQAKEDIRAALMAKDGQVQSDIARRVTRPKEV